MNISIAGYSFHGALADRVIDVFGYLESCRYRYHLDTADLWCGVLGPEPDVYLQPEFLAKVKQAMVERGLTLVNYHADGCHVWEDDADRRAEHRRLAERHIAAAEYLGAKTVRIDSGGRERHWSTQQMDVLSETYREWARRAADGGYRIGPETHWGTSNFTDDMLALHEAVDHPGYGILLHVGKTDFDVADPDAYDRRLAPIACHTHVDARNTMTRAESVMRILHDAGYQGALGVEHHSAVNEHREVEVQLAVIRRALARVTQELPEAGPSCNPLLSPRDNTAPSTA